MAIYETAAQYRFYATQAKADDNAHCALNLYGHVFRPPTIRYRHFDKTPRRLTTTKANRLHHFRQLRERSLIRSHWCLGRSHQCPAPCGTRARSLKAWPSRKGDGEHSPTSQSSQPEPETETAEDREGDFPNRRCCVQIPRPCSANCPPDRSAGDDHWRSRQTATRQADWVHGGGAKRD